MPEDPVPLRSNSNFMRLWAGQAISELGSMMGAVPLTAILVLKATPIQMGLLAAAAGAPALLFGLLAGVWVDRLRRRPILIAADLGRAALFATIPAAWLLGRLEMGQVYLVTALAGALTLLFEVAYPSYLPTLVEPERLVEANGRLGASASAAEIAGQSVGGGLIQLLGAPAAVLLDAVSFLFSAAAVRSIGVVEPPPPAVSERESVMQEIADGLKAVARHPVLRPIAESAALWIFFSGFYAALYGLFAIDLLGFGPALLGVVIACGGIGSLIGATLADRVASRFGTGATLAGSLSIAGALGVFVPLAGRPPFAAVPTLIAVQIAGDFFLTTFFITEISMRQTIAPGPLLGRVNASVYVVWGAAGLFGALAGGTIAQRVGVRGALFVSATGCLFPGLLLFLSPVRAIRRTAAPASIG